ncbi:MAG: diphthine--ammonia ligase [Nanoarchaeota archaeon]
MRLGALISSGKDSLFAVHLLKRQGHEIACALSMQSSNPDSYMFHTPDVHLVALQAEAMGVPLFSAMTLGEKEKELADLKALLKKAKDTYKIGGVCTGALFSEYQKSRIDKLCKELGLESLAPLWHMDQEQELRSLLKAGFRIMFTAVAAEGLDSSWLGREITEKDVDRLVALKEKFGINVAGEGGEYESLVLECPLFSRRIAILKSEVFSEDFRTARLAIKEADLQPL